MGVPANANGGLDVKVRSLPDPRWRWRGPAPVRCYVTFSDFTHSYLNAENGGSVHVSVSARFILGAPTLRFSGRAVNDGQGEQPVRFCRRGSASFLCQTDRVSLVRTVCPPPSPRSCCLLFALLAVVALYVFLFTTAFVLATLRFHRQHYRASPQTLPYSATPRAHTASTSPIRAGCQSATRLPTRPSFTASTAVPKWWCPVLGERVRGTSCHPAQRCSACTVVIHHRSATSDESFDLTYSTPPLCGDTSVPPRHADIHLSRMSPAASTITFVCGAMTKHLCTSGTQQLHISGCSVASAHPFFLPGMSNWKSALPRLAIRKNMDTPRCAKWCTAS
ncbi:hypothetical protein C8Q77DRAFT_1135501 [Trametes polyzona]|nr:hypothetical protein C8Q77DRAFT_1135501 [Trametes polyzona]